MPNITYLFPLYARVSSTILKSSQDFGKLAAFTLLPTKFSHFLSSTCLLFAIFIFNQFIFYLYLQFIFSQKEKRGFIWSKTFNFLFRKTSNIHSEKELFLKSSCCSLFRNTYLKEHLWEAASIYFNREASQKCKITTLQTNLKRVLISWRKYLFNSK